MSRIIEQNAVDVYTADTIEYMIAVNRLRQLPDGRDGLKKVNRRILDTMLNHLTCMTSKVKSAAVVGRTLEISHPHGDSSVYSAMKPMYNWFEKLYPYIEGQGNFGTKYGDPQAASRYTEVRISDFAKDALCLKEVHDFNNIVDWVPTFDNSHKEPEYFPTALPTLLIQGAFGIGVGIKTELPPHNLVEVVDATIELMYNPNAQVVLVPDQCMPCYVIDTDFKLISNKGHGSVVFRGIIDIEKRKGKDALVIKSAPDMVYIENVMEKVDELVASKQIQLNEDWYEEGVVDEYGRDITWYVLILKKGSDPHFVRDILYKKTSLENKVSIAFESLDFDYRPVRYSYKSYLQTFIEFRMLTKFRVYYSRLQTAQTKLHEKDAYIRALESGKIDDIIAMIRTRTDTDDTECMEYLIQLLDITDLQAKFIMNAGIKKLSIGYLNLYKQEAIELQSTIDTCLSIVQNDNLILQEIEQELLALKEKYGRPRNTIIIDGAESAIPRGEFKLIITNNNFIKKLPANMQGIGSLKGDSIKSVIKVDNTKDILLFDNIGTVHRLPVHKIPISDKSSNGVDIRLLCKRLTSNVVSVMYVPLLMELADSIDPYYITVVTSDGNIKKMELQDFLNVPLSGIIYFKCNGSIKDVKITHDTLDIVVYSGGEALRMGMQEVPLQKRNTKGVRVMSTDNLIDGFDVIAPDTTHVLVITNSGKINKFSISALPLVGRNKNGSKVIKLSKNDGIFSIHMCNEHNVLHVVTANTKLDIPVSDIESGSSISSGVKAVPLKNDTIIRTSIK